MNNKTTGPGKIFDILNALFMILLAISTLYPFIYLLSLSLSSQDVSFTKLYIVPPKISFDNFEMVLSNKYIAYGFRNTAVRTLGGTALSLFFTTFCGYSLSKKYFPHRTFWTSFIIITMFVNGGLIPTYLLVRDLKLIDSYWALVLPNLIPTFHMVIARNFFMTIPDSLEESARIDGANDILIFFRIIVPVSKPILATLALWKVVWHWNAWFDSMIYTTDSKMHVLMIVMRRIVLEGLANTMDPESLAHDETQIVNPETLKAATIMVTTVPVLIFYPFIQKYFVKGIMIGSLKG